MARVKHMAPVRLEVPHEPGNVFEVRQLSAEEMDEAAEVLEDKQTRKMMTKTADLPAHLVDVAIKQEEQRRLQEAAQARAEGRTPLTERDPLDTLAGYDKATLLHYGLVSWSGPLYTDPLPALEDEQARTAAIRELDQPTREWAAQAIFELSHILPGEGLRSETVSKDGADPAASSERNGALSLLQASTSQVGQSQP